MAQGIDLIFELKKEFELKEIDIRTYSPLTLAYIGDAIYDLLVRSFVVCKGNTSNNKLHKKTTKYVSAKAQAEIIKAIKEDLTEEEVAVYKRGKNAKPSSTAKNASLSEYLKATGFEALLGYLYLTGQKDRIVYIVKKGIEVVDGDNN